MLTRKGHFVTAKTAAPAAKFCGRSRTPPLRCGGGIHSNDPETALCRKAAAGDAHPIDNFNKLQRFSPTARDTFFQNHQDFLRKHAQPVDNI